MLAVLVEAALPSCPSACASMALPNERLWSETLVQAAGRPKLNSRLLRPQHGSANRKPTRAEAHQQSSVGSQVVVLTDDQRCLVVCILIEVFNEILVYFCLRYLFYLKETKNTITTSKNGSIWYVIVMNNT